MFDLFGIRARRKAKKEAEEAERLRIAQEEKRKYQERKNLIDKFLKEDWNRRYKLESEEYNKNKERAEKRNSVCPICGSKDIVHNIVRTKGEIHGKGSIDGSGYHSGGLFWSHGSSYISGRSKIDGELDTLPVNKCKQCGHEWNIEEAKWETIKSDFDSYDTGHPSYLYYRVKEYYEMTYDPYDVKEKFNSLEEKRENLCEEVSNNYSIRQYKKVPKYMLDYVFFQGMKKAYSYYSGVLGVFEWYDDMDEYSYVIPDNVWEVVKKLIGWEGPDKNDEKEE